MLFEKTLLVEHPGLEIELLARQWGEALAKDQLPQVRPYLVPTRLAIGLADGGGGACQVKHITVPLAEIGGAPPGVMVPHGTYPDPR